MNPPRLELILTKIQSWIGMGPELNCGHGSGIVQILATAPYRNSQDPFEQMLLMTIAGPVVCFCWSEPAA